MELESQHARVRRTEMKALTCYLRRLRPQQSSDAAGPHSWSGHTAAGCSRLGGPGRWAGQAHRTGGQGGSREEDRAPAGLGATRMMRGGQRKAPDRLLGSAMEDHL